jgi:hypothetical protein
MAIETADQLVRLLDDRRLILPDALTRDADEKDPIPQPNIALRFIYPSLHILARKLS